MSPPVNKWSKTYKGKNGDVALNLERTERGTVQMQVSGAHLKLTYEGTPQQVASFGKAVRNIVKRRT